MLTHIKHSKGSIVVVAVGRVVISKYMNQNKGK